MRIDILQKFIKENGEYLIGNRYIEGMGASRGQDRWEAILLTPDVDREYWVDDLGEMPFNKVESFANEEIKTIIHLGRTYQPFQYGIRRKDFINLEKVTCKPMELVVKCYEENISDYYKIIEAMRELENEV
jgi:hypothetical protein